jgi:lipid A 3-O-deacylase
MPTTAELAMSTLAHHFAAALAVCCSAAAAEPSAPSQEVVHFWTIENDRYFSTDEDYTSGVQLSLERAGGERGPVAGAVCAWLACADSTLLTSQTNLGHLIYTPRHIDWREAQPNERPWAGLLYYEQATTLLSPDRRTLTTLSGQVGVTGPLSLAEPLQKLFHRILDRPRPQGWDNQLGGSLGVLASAERRSALAAMSTTLGRHVSVNTAGYWRLAVGNIQTYAAAGMAVVVGKELPPVSPPPAGIGNKVSYGGAEPASGNTACVVAWLQCTAFASVEARLMAYNVFLDGRLWHDDPKVARRSVVHDLVFGTRLDFPNTRTASHGPWFLQFKFTRRSPEYRSSLPVQRHRVAALTIGTAF